MKAIVKKFYIVEEKNKRWFISWLKKNKLGYGDVAKKCGISIAYLSLMLDGKRYLTEEIKKIIKEMGYNFSRR